MNKHTKRVVIVEAQEVSLWTFCGYYFTLFLNQALQKWNRLKENVALNLCVQAVYIGIVIHLYKIFVKF